MEKNTLERISGQEEMSTVIMRCGQTGEVLAIPKRIYEQVQSKDKSIANTELSGFYISPGFSFYKTRSDFNMFCED
jgi:hypothetical protein